ncbi:hypothetical protein MCOR25_005950 [Pyricularia grisea]|uniref:Uncharacterized protein n=1 Tax=Pyricularia grisea TaxID=148305 RepID=A0A6P8AZG7_PYRGI|nr:hypothetical protein PgNI_11027 [Pyricularia grisea]KAI6363231.1 hypothetical protein MCOR25_005950 [Pyricularia grisea]TLD07715.1 hypothetical protein PgNI_11027 [Pyricularia grisea]
MSYPYTEPNERTGYTDSTWQHPYMSVTGVYENSHIEPKHSQPIYQPSRRGSTSHQRSSDNYKRQPAPGEPSSRRYPPTSNNKIFGRDYSEPYNAGPSTRPRSSSHSQPTYPADIFRPLQRSSSTRTRQNSYSSSQKPSGERSWSAFGVSSENRHDPFGRHDTPKEQYRHGSVVVDDEYDSKERYPKSQRHEGAEPREDERRRRKSSRKGSRTGDFRPERSSQYEMLQAELDSLLSANVKGYRMAEAAWTRKAWHEASVIYGRLGSDLMRLADVDRQLGGSNYIESRRQADKAVWRQNMALDKWLSSHKRRYDHHIADAEAFEYGPNKHLAKANQSYVSAIMILIDLKRVSPSRLEAHFPGHIEELQCKLRKVQAKIDKQTSEEDSKAASAVRTFIGQFHLVEKLIEQGEGQQARYQFDRAKETLVKTLVTLPQRFVPSKEWVEKMGRSIEDQERRAKERFGKDW